MSVRHALIAVVVAVIATSCADGGAVRASASGTATRTSSATATPVETRTSVVPSASASPMTRPTPGQSPTADDERIVAAIVAFARDSNARTFAALPLSDQVGLELDDQIPLPRNAAALARADGWILDVNEFNGHSGPFSALDLLSRNVATAISIGPHAHCASPATATPAALADLRRISVQPKDVDTCLQWWAVDVYVSPAGKIEVVALDLWSP